MCIRDRPNTISNSRADAAVFCIELRGVEHVADLGERPISFLQWCWRRDVEIIEVMAERFGFVLSLCDQVEKVAFAVGNVEVVVGSNPFEAPRQIVLVATTALGDLAEILYCALSRIRRRVEQAIGLGYQRLKFTQRIGQQRCRPGIRIDEPFGIMGKNTNN